MEGAATNVFGWFVVGTALRVVEWHRVVGVCPVRRRMQGVVWYRIWKSRVTRKVQQALPVLSPFSNISRHVVKAPGVGSFSPDGLRPLADLGKVGTVPPDVVCTWIRRVVAALGEWAVVEGRVRSRPIGILVLIPNVLPPKSARAARVPGGMVARYC